MAHRHIACDLDGTLAQYDGWKGPTVIGEPIPKMLERVRMWRAMGIPVTIFTARVWHPGLEIQHIPDASEYEEARRYKLEAERALIAVKNWCLKHLGEVLPVSCIKTMHFTEFWEDRAVAVSEDGHVMGMGHSVAHVSQEEERAGLAMAARA